MANDVMSDQSQPAPEVDISEKITMAHDALIDVVQVMQEKGAPPEVIAPMVSIVKNLRSEVGKIMGDEEQPPQPAQNGQLPPNAGPGVQPAMMQP